MNISVVLPTYNEKRNIAILIPEIERKIFTARNNSGEIIVVDDSSPDGTGEEVKKLQKRYKNIRLITRKNKCGLGAALFEGYSKARGDIILSSDTDLSFEVEDMMRLLDKINEGYDLVVGSRHSRKGYYHTPTLNIKLKELLSKYGNILNRLATGVQIDDFSANFRAIRRDVWKQIHVVDTSNAFLLEMIVKTSVNRYKITQVPIIFQDRKYGESKLNLKRELFKYLLRLMIILFQYRILRHK